ncbi:MAG: ribonuclease J [Actinomycetota bacterium]
MTSGRAAVAGGPTRVIFLGGVGEIGRNMTVIEHGDRLLIVDVGLMFPTEEMLGVDLVIPDFQYVRERADKVLGILLTHGHEDHIGGLPYLLREISPPIFGSRLTLGLLRPKLEEHGMGKGVRMQEVKVPGQLSLAPFQLRFLQVAHSIPGGMGILVTTPAGTILHTGDFRLDQTPVDARPTDLQGFAAVGEEGVDLMLADSTNALVPGQLPSERSVGEAIKQVIRRARGRVIVTCFASHIHRVQQVLEAAEDSGRLVAFVGRSMLTNVRVARQLGYLRVPETLLVPIEEIGSYPASKIVVVSTGSQGEPLSALALMAAREHRFLDLESEDTVVFSATPIPGNESAVRRVIDRLARIGLEVVAAPAAPVHVSGHAAAGELTFMLELVRPRCFIPIHGEYRQLAAHARLAREAGVTPDRAVVVEDGDVVEMEGGRITKVDQVQAGYVFVDGLGIGDVGDVVIRDRRLLSEDGILVCVVTLDSQSGKMLAGPDLISRGFVYEEQAGGFYERARTEVRESLASLARQEATDWAVVRRHVRKALGRFVWSEVRRRPIILPVVMEV